MLGGENCYDARCPWDPRVGRCLGGQLRFTLLPGTNPTHPGLLARRIRDGWKRPYMECVHEECPVELTGACIALIRARDGEGVPVCNGD